ncbi:hypothetical protein BX600DRAFT_510195 [Xylariales sp. PMI_506]|nr:hypothetical protein BX600DRAFT_510195 [Xylariales sp. PMI_506]
MDTRSAHLYSTVNGPYHYDRTSPPESHSPGKPGRMLNGRVARKSVSGSWRSNAAASIGNTINVAMSTDDESAKGAYTAAPQFAAGPPFKRQRVTEDIVRSHSSDHLFSLAKNGPTRNSEMNETKQEYPGGAEASRSSKVAPLPLANGDYHTTLKSRVHGTYGPQLPWIQNRHPEDGRSFERSPSFSGPTPSPNPLSAARPRDSFSPTLHQNREAQAQDPRHYYQSAPSSRDGRPMPPQAAPLRDMANTTPRLPLPYQSQLPANHSPRMASDRIDGHAFLPSRERAVAAADNSHDQQFRGPSRQYSPAPGASGSSGRTGISALVHTQRHYSPLPEATGVPTPPLIHSPYMSSNHNPLIATSTALVGSKPSVSEPRPAPARTDASGNSAPTSSMHTSRHRLDSDSRIQSRSFTDTSTLPSRSMLQSATYLRTLSVAEGSSSSVLPQSWNQKRSNEATDTSVLTGSPGQGDRSHRSGQILNGAGHSYGYGPGRLHNHAQVRSKPYEISPGVKTVPQASSQRPTTAKIIDLTTDDSEPQSEPVSVQTPRRSSSRPDVPKSSHESDLLSAKKEIPRSAKSPVGQPKGSLPPQQQPDAPPAVHDSQKFDSYIYGAPNEPNRPGSSLYDLPEYGLSVNQNRREPRFGHFDPRIHWTWARTPEWYERKQKEIAARGNRKSKDNYGQAVARLARKIAKEGPRGVKLPDRVRENPAWLAAAKELDDMAEDYHEEQRSDIRRQRKDKAGAAFKKMFPTPYLMIFNGSVEEAAGARKSGEDETMRDVL